MSLKIMAVKSKLAQFHIAIICTLLGYSLQGAALTDDNQQPINIQSDSASQKTLEHSEKTEYVGNVVMTQGSTSIRGDHIIIHSQEHKVLNIVALGSPAKFQQQSDPNTPPVKAAAKTIDYQLKTEIITLTGDASIEQDRTIVSGERIEYNTATEQVIASGGTDNHSNSRVNVVLVPAQAEQPTTGEIDADPPADQSAEQL